MFLIIKRKLEINISRFFRLKSRTNRRITEVHSARESSQVFCLNTPIAFNLFHNCIFQHVIIAE